MAEKAVKEGWAGDWNADKTVFTGTYTWPDGGYWTGTASWLTTHVIVHSTPDGYTKRVEHPVEPHWEFTGGDVGGKHPIPPPDDRQ